MSTTMIEAKYAVTSELASRLCALLEPLATERAKDCYGQLTAFQAQLRRLRHQAELAVQRYADARTALKQEEVRVEIGIRSSIGIGQTFGFSEIADLSHQRSAWHLTLEDLEVLFARHGAFGQEFARMLNEVGNDYRRAVAEADQARTEHDQLRVDFQSTYFELQGAIGVARAVLQSAGVPLPRVARPKRKRPEARAANDVRERPALSSEPVAA